MNLLLIDIETGGTDPFSHSVLQVSVGVLECTNPRVPMVQSWLVKEDNISIDPHATVVNKITESTVWNHGQPPGQVARGVLNYLRRVGADRPSLAGWNVGFDRGFLRRLFRESQMADHHERFEAAFNHRCLDHQSVVRDRIARGELHPAIESFSDALLHFGIVNEKPHDAEHDVRALIQLHRALYPEVS